jgi:PAS domain S-box-containing protein
MNYLTSGKPEDLATYRASLPALTARLDQLRGLTSDNPEQVRNVNRLAMSLQARTRAWEDEVGRKQAGEPPDLSSVVAQSMDLASDSQNAASTIRETEGRLLSERTEAAHRRFILAVGIVVTGVVVAILLLCFYQFMLSKELQARIEAEQRVREALTRETTLRAEAERFRLFIHAVQDHAIFTLDPDGEVSSWNEGAARLKGYSASEILGRHFSCFYTEKDLEEGRPKRLLEQATRDGRVEDEGWRVRKDGCRFWANVIITAIRDGSGILVGYVKITRDFTDRMRSQEALRTTNAVLVKEISERQSAESRLAASEKSLRQLSLHLLHSQDLERKRIGRDLHDSLGQSLAVLKMNLDSLQSLIGSDQPEIAGPIASCITLVKDVLIEVRTISYLLYPPLLEEMGLKSAIPWYLEGFSKRSGIETTFNVDAAFGRLVAEVELALFRILQEALTNVHRHSGSATASVRLFLAGDAAVLEVRDRGRGISSRVLSESGADWTNSMGVGLRGMNERMRQLGGRLEICSNGDGTVVTANVPLRENAAVFTRSA